VQHAAGSSAPAFEPDDAVHFIGARREEDDGRRRDRHQSLEQIEAVDVRQSDVEDDERDAFVLGRSQRRLTGGAPHRVVAFGRQGVADGVGYGRLVFDNEDSGAHGTSVRLYRSSNDSIRRELHHGAPITAATQCRQRRAGPTSLLP
jgi:hypothetical protein